MATMKRVKTPCEELGYKVGDKFEVLSGGHVGFENGQIVELYKDDGSKSLLFKGDNSQYKYCDGEPGAFLSLVFVKPLSKTKEPPNDQEDRIFDALEKQGHFVQTDVRQNKYLIDLKGVQVDVYDVIVALGITNPADAHAFKKIAMPGKRGLKDGIKDREEAIQALQRAIEIEKAKNV